MSVKIWLLIGVAFASGASAALFMRPATTPFLSSTAHEISTTDRARALGPTSPAANPVSLSNAARFQVRFKDDLLTVKAEDALLKDLMKEISRRAYIAIELGDGVAEHRISADFTDLPLEAGLRQVLAGHDVFSYHRGGRGLLTVWVYGKLEGRSLFPIPFETWASTADLQHRLDGVDATERVAALEELVARGGSLSEQEVTMALDDDDERGFVWVLTKYLDFAQQVAFGRQLA